MPLKGHPIRVDSNSVGSSTAQNRSPPVVSRLNYSNIKLTLSTTRGPPLNTMHNSYWTHCIGLVWVAAFGPKRAQNPPRVLFFWSVVHLLFFVSQLFPSHSLLCVSCSLIPSAICYFMCAEPKWTENSGRIGWSWVYTFFVFVSFVCVVWLHFDEKIRSRNISKWCVKHNKCDSCDREPTNWSSRDTYIVYTLHYMRGCVRSVRWWCIIVCTRGTCIEDTQCICDI